MSATPPDTTGQLVDKVVQLKRMLGQFGRLVEISLTLNTTLDQEQILDFILETASEVLDCEAVSILLYDEDKGELRLVASTNTGTDELNQILIPLEDSIAGTVFLQNSPQIINDLSRDPRHFHLVSQSIDLYSQSLVGVPMRMLDQVIGVLEGINKRDGDFTREDADILAIIASQAAIAIHNARLLGSLQAAYDELRRMDKIKSDFIAIASHELRTPLFHIMGYAQLLEEETQGTSSDNVRRVLESVKLLQSLVDDMTNMDLLQMRAKEFTMVRVPVQQIIMDAYKETEPLMVSKEHIVTFDLLKQPAYILADPLKLRRAFVNVLNNAAHFSSDGGQITVSAYIDRQNVHIAIKDNGIGIHPDHLEAVFDRFYQVESHLTRSYGGLGLGLPIARGLVDLHRGNIWAESEGENKGTTIQIMLPLAIIPPFIDS